MKRRKFITHLETHGCHLYREGGKHTLYYNPANKQIASVPRHKEVSEFTAYAICQALRYRDQNRPSFFLFFFLSPAAKKPRPEADFRRRQPEGHEFELFLQLVFVVMEL